MGPEATTPVRLSLGMCGLADKGGMVGVSPVLREGTVSRTHLPTCPVRPGV